MPAASVTQIARLAGVSHTTVSLVLNGRPVRVRDETRERILETARRLNYRPNVMARAMQSRLFRQIGVVVDYRRDWFPSFEMPILCGTAAFLSRHDWRVCVIPSSGEARRDPRHFFFAREHGLDGLIVLDLWETLSDILRSLRIPHVHANGPAGPNAVSVDDARLGYEGTRRLLAAGHRRIAFCTFQNYRPAVEGRRRGYQAAMREAGLAACIVDDPSHRHIGFDFHESWATHEGTVRERFRRCLRRVRPTALLAFSDITALRFYRFLAEAGLRVPRDVSVLALDSSSDMTLAIPPLSGYRVRFLEVGEKAAELLLRRVSGEKAAPPPPIGADFVEGESVAPPPRP